MKRNNAARWGLGLTLISCLLLLVTHAEPAWFSPCAETHKYETDCGDFSGIYQPLKEKNLLAVVSTSSDFDNGIVTESADAAVFGSDISAKDCPLCEGRGIEPMAHAVAETVYHDNRALLYGATAFANGNAEIRHRYRLTDDAPSGDWKLAIPGFVHYRLETSVGGGATASAYLWIQAPGMSFSKQAADGQKISGTLSFNKSAFDEITIHAQAGVHAQYQDVWNGIRTERFGGSAQAVADPFLFVDPNWEYARYVVVEQESLLHPGEWVEVTRAWRNPPIVNAGPDRNAYTGRATSLEGSATDPDGEPIISWTWSVQGTPPGAFDLQDANTPTASFRGNAPGDYTLELKACSYVTSCGTDYVTIHVADNLPPVATTTATPTTVYVGGQVCFDGSGSSDPETGPLTYAWDFGDGTEGSNAPAPCHTYTAEGTFAARLVVTDEIGLTDDDLLTIVVRMPNYPPVVSPTATPITGPAPLTVQFAANATDADNNPITYVWNFGDSTTSGEPNPVHDYTAPGTYTVSLIVSDGQASALASLTIAVSPTIQLSVRMAGVKWWNKHQTMGMVHVWADLTAPMPIGDEVVRVTLDGISLLAEPFSTFRHEPWTDSYVLAKRGLVARLDFNRGRVFVLTPKISLIGLDNSNGLDVEVSIGPATAVENITMSEAPGDRLIYRRAGVADEP